MPTKTITKTNNQLLREKTGLSQRQIVSNILAVWESATDVSRTDGAQWYAINGEAIDKMASGTGVSRETAAAVTAHLSPRIHWARNLIAAHEVLHGRPVSGIMSRSLAGAQEALAAYALGDNPLWTLNGPKTKNFALNLLGDTEAVTIDVWAARVAMPGIPREDVDKIMKYAGVYDALAHCYRLAATKAGVAPATMQATTWIVARNGRAN
jgi:hypothetical protein